MPFALGPDGPSNPSLNSIFATTPADCKEALTREQAVRANTTGAASTEFQKQQKGALAPGKLDESAGLSQAVFAVPPPVLPSTGAR